MKANIKTEISSLSIFSVPENSNELIITSISGWNTLRFIFRKIISTYIFIYAKDFLTN